MKTIYEFLLQDVLIVNGVFENIAGQLLIDWIDSDTKQGGPALSMYNRWGEPSSAYPEMMLNILTMSLATYTVKYLRENVPRAWNLPVFMVLTRKSQWDTLDKATLAHEQFVTGLKNEVQLPRTT